MTAVALLTHVRVVVDHTLTIITAKINKVKRSHTIFFSTVCLAYQDLSSAKKTAWLKCFAPQVYSHLMTFIFNSK